MSQLITPAPVLSEPPDYIPTGNLSVSLPSISRRDAGVYCLGVLQMGANALLEISGSEAERQPFLQPFLMQDGRRLALGALQWRREGYWLPQFLAKTDRIEVQGTIYAPPGEKGFVYLLELKTRGGECMLDAGVEGWWKGVEAAIFQGREVEARRRLWHDPWSGSLTGEALAGLPLVAWGLQPGQDGDLHIEGDHFRWSSPIVIGADSPARLAFYVAVNKEADGARTTALHLRRRGWQDLLSATRRWLRDHTLAAKDKDLERILNENLFFNYFYAQGICLDTEELALVTSRSRAYYVSAAFWARDAFLWSFPGLLLTDPVQARQALSLGLTRYLSGAAEHALYLNGHSLYPGFELDEACAPLVALRHYLEKTADWDFTRRSEVLPALDALLRRIEAHRDPATGLYDTFLTPHDDPTDYPFLTYNNALVWRSFNVLAGVADHTGGGCLPPAHHLRSRAAELKAAIYQRCVSVGPFGRQFTGALSRSGEVEWVDFPGGSLSLLPFYGFCEDGDPIYQNTLRWIYSAHNPYYYAGNFGGAGSPHFRFPSCFDLANRLLRKQAEAGQMVKMLRMDHGLACESFDAQTGVVRTGAAFATMAGFLGFALHEYLA